MNTSVKLTGNGSRGIPPVVIGLLYSLGVTAGLSLLTGSVLHFTSLSETSLPALSVVVLLSSVFVGGTASAKRAGGKGLVQGLTVGSIYFLVITLVSITALQTPITAAAMLQKALMCLLAGALGGVFGVAR